MWPMISSPPAFPVGHDLFCLVGGHTWFPFAKNLLAGLRVEAHGLIVQQSLVGYGAADGYMRHAEGVGHGSGAHGFGELPYALHGDKESRIYDWPRGLFVVNIWRRDFAAEKLPFRESLRPPFFHPRLEDLHFDRGEPAFH